jgi:2-amino-4-hydroxy-6-hydroxymethyldihydropteridine diphosphokinase
VAEPIVIGIGGNIGEPHEIAQRFADVRLELAALGELTAALLYRAAPIGPAQPEFYNTAIRLDPTRSLVPEHLLDELQAIERSFGRDRASEQRFGPRTIDLDILVWGSRIEASFRLAIPHPRLRERRFALQPLIDVVGADFEIAGVGRAGELLAAVADQQVVPVGAW